MGARDRAGRRRDARGREAGEAGRRAAPETSEVGALKRSENRKVPRVLEGHVTMRERVGLLAAVERNELTFSEICA